MAENKIRAGDWSVFITVISLLCGAIWVSRTAEDRRPSPPAASGESVHSLQDVNARLWQDPFEAVNKHANAASQKQGCLLDVGNDAAVKLDVRCPAPATLTETDLSNLMEELLANPLATNRITVVAVMVNGGSTAGSDELRRQARYAVIAGLKAEHYQPDDAEHLGYIKTKGESEGIPDTIPFEWFEHQPRLSTPGDPDALENAGPVDRVLVLWLNEDVIDGTNYNRTGACGPKLSEPQPMARLASLFLTLLRPGEMSRECGILTQPASGTSKSHRSAQAADPPGQPARTAALTEATAAERLRFTVIGPANSGTLRHIGKELATCKATDGASHPLRLHLYSPWATAAGTGVGDREEKLCNGPPPEPSETPGRTAPFLVDFHRIGATDDQLVKLLIDELEQRFASDPEGMVLIGQWDTEYARNLRRNFCTAMAKRERDIQGLSRVEYALRHVDDTYAEDFCVNLGVTQYNFLRGVDGKTRDGDNPVKSGTEAKAAQASEGEISPDKAAEPRGEGSAQTDYVSRLLDALNEKDHMLRAQDLWEWPGIFRGIRSVGIIGNDYYDKLQLLSMLKPAFPEAVFFTTELDANMLNQDDNRWMRNLIVASPFGLRLPDDLQEDTPPFRSSGQTAAFLSVRLALDPFLCGAVADIFKASRKPAKVAASKNSAGASPPRLFEIGRTQAVDLMPKVPAPPIATSAAQSPPHIEWALLAVLSLTALPCLFPYWRCGWRNFLQDLFETVKRLRQFWTMSPWKHTLALVFLALPIAAAALLTIESRHVWMASAEPLYWLEGVSLWPSELLQFLAIIMTLLFMFLTHRTVERSDWQTSEHFFGYSRARANEIAFSKGRMVRSQGRKLLAERKKTPFEQEFHFARRKRESGPNRSPEIVVHLWADYLRTSLLLPSAGAAMVFLIFSSFIMLSHGFPIAPGRGQAMFALDGVLTLTVIFLFFWLLFYISYATSRITRLAKGLWGKTIWPESSLRKLGLQHGHAKENWMDIKLLARCTEDFKFLQLYPIIILALITFAHSRVFDGWSFPWPLLVLYGVCVVIIVSYPLRLSRAAEASRAHGLEYLETALARARASPPENNTTLVAELQAIIEDAKRLDKGAFAPFTRQDWVQTLLALAGSASAYTLLDYFQFG